MKRVDRIALDALVLLLGTVALMAMFPLGLRRIYRIARRLVRKTIKPLCLWLNACRFEESEHEMSRLHLMRISAERGMSREREHQERLQQQRNQIAGW